ncbi:MAG: CBS domain-containing protein [Anaerolineae bacterium]
MEVILTHENADFDAIASLLGAHKLFPAAVPVLPRRINRNGSAFLALYGAELPLVHPDDLSSGTIDRAILVDTQSLTTLKGMVENLRVDIIDHHRLGRSLPANWTYSGEQMGATTTLLTEEISARFLRLDQLEATLLLLGIYEDTGSLSYQSTTVRDVRAAAWLMEQGARLDQINEFLHWPLGVEQRDLYERLLEVSQTYEIEGHTIVIAAESAAEYSDELSTLAHKLRDLLTPSALFMIVALDGRIQLVARSTTDDIDVATVARRFGGGGHARAAAALIHNRGLEAVCAELLEVLPDVVQPAVTVAEAMSFGVQVLSPEETVAEAANQMRRTGHEGYPIVQDDRVVGLVTRRDVDRALQFEMSSAPVTQIMDAGNVTVGPSDSVEYVQQLMIESGWGQIPVVDDDQVVGVVTRTDLITLWGMPPKPSRRLEIAARVERALSDPVLALVRHISRIAQEMGFVPYFVGGLLRDMLLGQPIADVDMVIEGDAIALADRLASELGGRVIAHRRFSTAKWLLSEDVWAKVVEDVPVADKLLSSIDFVTARTEFYTYPTALPQVAQSSIKQDLHRRDFTINTLAIRLDPDHWGEILDFYGGETDLEQGVIRVLHSLSFIDDPTRILRAARLESRLGFRLDPRSEQLIEEALPLLNRVSGDRVRHELELMFREDSPELALSRLDELNALPYIHADLTCDDWLRAKYGAYRENLVPEVWGLSSEDELFIHLALLAYRLEAPGLNTLSRRLKLKRDGEDDLLLVRELRLALPELDRLRRPSAAYGLLRPYPARVLAVNWIATEREVAQRHLYAYQTEWRLMEAEVTGADLKAAGLVPGPLFGQLLDAVRDARLNGEVRSRDEELALVEAMLADAHHQAGRGRGREDNIVGPQDHGA